MGGINKDNTPSVIKFEDRTYAAIKYLIEEKNKIKSTEENDYFFYEDVLEVLRKSIDDQYLYYQIIEGPSMVDYKNAKIYVSPKAAIKECAEKEFVYMTCRYAANNCKEAAPGNDQYMNYYHLFQMLKYVYLQREIYLAKDNSLVGDYLSTVLFYITEKDITKSKKFQKLTKEEQEYLSYIRYANLNAARFLCELFRTDKANSYNGCFQLLSYILYTTYLLDGYVKKDFLARKVDTNPIHETFKIFGSTDQAYHNNNMSTYEKVTHGFEIDLKVLAFIKDESFENYRGTFVNKYYETEQILKRN